MRVRSLALLGIAIVTQVIASAVLAQTSDRANEPAPTWDLLVAQGALEETVLEARGARIGRIDVSVDDVFESTNGLSAPYRAANGLHMSTRVGTVRSQILFASGDEYDGRLIEETARLLRAQRYFGDASVRPVRYHEDANTVDVLVRVHDVWTLSPGFSFGRKGGENSTRFKFEDTNFLGMGKQLSLARAADVDRSAWRLAYTDPNVLGSWWKLSAAYATLSDGSEETLAVSRPFYSLDTRWSVESLMSDTTSAVPRYALGESVEEFQMRAHDVEIGGGVSGGLVDGWVRRYLGGFRYGSREFAPLPGYENARLPEARVVAYPWIGVEVIEDEYRQTRNLNQIGRTEDLYLGRSARLELGYASSAFGSTHDALILNGKLSAGVEPDLDQYLINSLHFRSRLQVGTFQATQLDLESRYYLRQSPRTVLFAAATAAISQNLDLEEQLLLGGDNGLRGYPLRYQAGTRRALLTLEERFYSNWQPLKLVNVGAAVFFDAGRTWGTDPFAPAPAGWLKDVGIGLRLGSARSGLGNVLHIDLAFPLDGGSDIDSVQLLIESRRSF